MRKYPSDKPLVEYYFYFVVATGIPLSLFAFALAYFYADSLQTLLLLVCMGVSSTFWVAVLSFAATRALARTFRSLAEAAERVAQGTAFEALRMPLWEANRIGRALQAASDQIGDQAEGVFAIK